MKSNITITNSEGINMKMLNTTSKTQIFGGGSENM